MFLLSLHVSAFVPLVWVKAEVCLAFSVFTSEKFIFFATHQLSVVEVEGESGERKENGYKMAIRKALSTILGSYEGRKQTQPSN